MMGGRGPHKGCELRNDGCHYSEMASDRGRAGPDQPEVCTGLQLSCPTRFQITIISRWKWELQQQRCFAYFCLGQDGLRFGRYYRALPRCVSPWSTNDAQQTGTTRIEAAALSSMGAGVLQRGKGGETHHAWERLWSWWPLGLTTDCAMMASQSMG